MPEEVLALVLSILIWAGERHFDECYCGQEVIITYGTRIYFVVSLSLYVSSNFEDVKTLN